MRFVNPIPFVSDIERSKAFYGDLLGLKILSDFGDFVLFETGFAIHDGRSLERTVWKKNAETSEPYGRLDAPASRPHAARTPAPMAIGPAEPAQNRPILSDRSAEPRLDPSSQMRGIDNVCHSRSHR